MQSWIPTELSAPAFRRWCTAAGRRTEHLVSIYQKLLADNGEVFGTRASEHQYEIVKQVIPEITYDRISHILKAEKAGKRTCWQCSGVHGRHGRYSSGRRGSTDGGIFRYKGRTDL